LKGTQRVNKRLNYVRGLYLSQLLRHGLCHLRTKPALAFGRIAILEEMHDQTINAHGGNI
jgi:hypothetical protein